MFRGIKKFVRSPAGRRVATYLAPLVVGWVISKLQGDDTTGSGKKSRRRK